MEENLNILEKRIMIRAKKKIYKKYGDCTKNYYRHKIFDLLYSRSTNFNINYKEIIIYNSNQEYNKRYYKQNESILKLIKILKYYINYLTFFCRPIFIQFYYYSILQNYYDLQADIFYRKNYLKKGEKEEYLKNTSNYNDEEEENKDIKTLSKNNSNLIFDNKTRKYIDTSTNLLTSIDRDIDESKNNETYVQKMKINNKYITIKNNDDYLLDLIEIIKTKRKEDKVKNKNLNININYSLSQGKKKYLKKPKIIKKNKTLFNSNKNTIENNIYTSYNVNKTMSKKKNPGKNIYNAIIFNSNINLSDIKSKSKNKNNDSQKKIDKSQKKKNKNKYLSGSGKENKNFNVLKTKIIKRISVNLNNIKPGVFNLYKRSSLNYKYNHIKKNNNCKKTSFSIYKNYSIITSNSNIHNKLYISNSNSPINKLKKYKNDNKSDIFNFSKKNKPKKFELKKNLYFNIAHYLSNKKRLQKRLNKNSNFIKNNNYFFNNNIYFTNNINQNHKNKIYNCLYKKTNNNNSISKNKTAKTKNYIKNKSNNELYYKKKYLGKNDSNLLINNLSSYFNSKNIRSKSLLKSKPKIAVNNEKLHTFSMRVKNHNKNHSTSGYLNINNQFFNQNFSYNNIDYYNKNNNSGKNNKLINNHIKKKSLKFCINSIDKLPKNLTGVQNVKLFYKKNNNIDKNGVNLNVNFNLNNINININDASSGNTNTNSNLNNNLSNKILDKLNINNNNSNYMLSNNNDFCGQNIKQNKENIKANLINGNIKNKNYISYYKSRNKMQNKISKKNIEKILNNLNYNIKSTQNNSKQFENLLINKNSYAQYKSNIVIKNKIKNNSSFSISGINKTISLINKKQINQDKTKKIKDDNKRISSFVLNKRYKEINNYKKKDNNTKNFSNILIKKK